MKIKLIINEANRNLLNEWGSGKLFTVYHNFGRGGEGNRFGPMLNSEEIANSILDSGYRIGGGDFYGPGIYTVAKREDLRDRYGTSTMRFAVNLDRFLILEKSVAEVVFQAQDPPTPDKQWQRMTGIKSDSRIYNKWEEYSGDTAKHIWKHVKKHGFEGMCFRGYHDGVVVVGWNPSLFIPTGWKLEQDTEFRNNVFGKPIKEWWRDSLNRRVQSQKETSIFRDLKEQIENNVFDLEKTRKIMYQISNKIKENLPNFYNLITHQPEEKIANFILKFPNEGNFLRTVFTLLEKTYRIAKTKGKNVERIFSYLRLIGKLKYDYFTQEAMEKSEHIVNLYNSIDMNSDMSLEEINKLFEETKQYFDFFEKKTAYISSEDYDEYRNRRLPSTSQFYDPETDKEVKILFKDLNNKMASIDIERVLFVIKSLSKYFEDDEYGHLYAYDRSLGKVHNLLNFNEENQKIFERFCSNKVIKLKNKIRHNRSKARDLQEEKEVIRYLISDGSQESKNIADHLFNGRKDVDLNKELKSIDDKIFSLSVENRRAETFIGFLLGYGAKFINKPGREVDLDGNDDDEEEDDFGEYIPF